ncbi:MAG: ATP-binding cassette domain-containing protein [Bdellovibrionales bacterium]
MIQFKNLKKNFGSREILRGLDLTISKGEIIFLLGKSGVGKSVLLKMIVGLMAPSSGEILLDGEEISNKSEEEFFEVRKKCGMVFQHPALFDSLSIFDNVAFGLRKSLKLNEEEVLTRVKKSLELVHLKTNEDFYNKKASEISYGTQKRVSLARSLAVAPEVLLFDEPTTGLDPISTNAINNLIQNLSRTLNTTSIVVSHDMECALAIADQIVVLNEGMIIAKGTPQEIRTNQLPVVKEFMAEVKHG